MTQSGFIAAMAAELAFADYAVPAALESCSSEWIIVSVWGDNRDFFTLSRTGVPVQGHEAPPGLQPGCSYLGILLSRAGGDTEEVSEYLLMRNQPADIPVGGVFHPTDGYVRLTLRDGVPGLTAHGRFAHAPGTQDGALGVEPVVRDVPDPARGAPEASAWHMRAIRRPWIGEVAAAERLVPRLSIASRPAALPRPRRPVQALVVPPRDRQVARHPVVEPPAGHLAPAGPTPHSRRRKRPEAKHDVTSEA